MPTAALIRSSVRYITSARVYIQKQTISLYKLILLIKCNKIIKEDIPGRKYISYNRNICICECIYTVTQIYVFPTILVGSGVIILMFKNNYCKLWPRRNLLVNSTVMLAMITLHACHCVILCNFRVRTTDKTVWSTVISLFVLTRE